MSTNDHLHSFRLPTTEFHTLADAAQQAGESLSAFIRKAIQKRMKPSRWPILANTTATVADVEYITGIVTATRNVAQYHVDMVEVRP